MPTLLSDTHQNQLSLIAQYHKSGHFIASLYYLLQALESHNTLPFYAWDMYFLDKTLTQLKDLLAICPNLERFYVPEIDSLQRKIKINPANFESLLKKNKHNRAIWVYRLCTYEENLDNKIQNRTFPYDDKSICQFYKHSQRKIEEKRKAFDTYNWLFQLIASNNSSNWLLTLGHSPHIENFICQFIELDMISKHSELTQHPFITTLWQILADISQTTTADLRTLHLKNGLLWIIALKEPAFLKNYLASLPKEYCFKTLLQFYTLNMENFLDSFYTRPDLLYFLLSHLKKSDAWYLVQHMEVRFFNNPSVQKNDVIDTIAIFLQQDTQRLQTLLVELSSIISANKSAYDYLTAIHEQLPCIMLYPLLLDTQPCGAHYLCQTTLQKNVSLYQQLLHFFIEQVIEKYLWDEEAVFLLDILHRLLSRTRSDSLYHTEWSNLWIRAKHIKDSSDTPLAAAYQLSAHQTSTPEEQRVIAHFNQLEKKLPHVPFVCIALFRDFFEDPEMLAASILWLAAKGNSLKKILSTSLLHDYYLYCSGDREQLEKFYNLLRYFELTKKMPDMVQIIRVHASQHQYASLDGSTHAALTRTLDPSIYTSLEHMPPDYHWRDTFLYFGNAFIVNILHEYQQRHLHNKDTAKTRHILVQNLNNQLAHISFTQQEFATLLHHLAATQSHLLNTMHDMLQPQTITSLFSAGYFSVIYFIPYAPQSSETLPLQCTIHDLRDYISEHSAEKAEPFQKLQIITIVFAEYIAKIGTRTLICHDLFNMHVNLLLRCHKTAAQDLAAMELVQQCIAQEGSHDCYQHILQDKVSRLCQALRFTIQTNLLNIPITHIEEEFTKTLSTCKQYLGKLHVLQSILPQYCKTLSTSMEFQWSSEDIAIHWIKTFLPIQVMAAANWNIKIQKIISILPNVHAHSKLNPIVARNVLFKSLLKIENYHWIHNVTHYLTNVKQYTDPHWLNLPYEGQPFLYHVIEQQSFMLLNYIIDTMPDFLLQNILKIKPNTLLFLQKLSKTRAFNYIQIFLSDGFEKTYATRLYLSIFVLYNYPDADDTCWNYMRSFTTAYMQGLVEQEKKAPDEPRIYLSKPITCLLEWAVQYKKNHVILSIVENISLPQCFSIVTDTGLHDEDCFSNTFLYSSFFLENIHNKLLGLSATMSVNDTQKRIQNELECYLTIHRSHWEQFSQLMRMFAQNNRCIQNALELFIHCLYDKEPLILHACYAISPHIQVLRKLDWNGILQHRFTPPFSYTTHLYVTRFFSILLDNDRIQWHSALVSIIIECCIFFESWETIDHFFTKEYFFLADKKALNHLIHAAIHIGNLGWIQHLCAPPFLSCKKLSMPLAEVAYQSALAAQQETIAQYLKDYMTENTSDHLLNTQSLFENHACFFIGNNPRTTDIIVSSTNPEPNTLQ